MPSIINPNIKQKFLIPYHVGVSRGKLKVSYSPSIRNGNDVVIDSQWKNYPVVSSNIFINMPY